MTDGSHCNGMPRPHPIAFAAAFLVGMQVPAVALAKETNRGRLMLSAFECATYAGMSANEDEQVRLFKIGYDAGKDFLEDWQNGTLSEAERRKAPVFVLLLLEGPSVDFMIGRVFEFAAQHAHDAIVRMDSNGVSLDPSEWVRDDELVAITASNKYRRSNCDLIQ